MSAWMRAIESAFNQTNSYYIYREKNKIMGILPLFFVKTLLSGIKAVSIPWAVYGGILADSIEIHDKLLEFAKTEINKGNINFLELRYLNEVNIKLPKQHLYVTYIKRLEENEEEILLSVPRKSRASIRNGYNKFGLKSKISRDIDILYKLYLLNKRKLGSPPYPRKFFQSLINEFKDNAGILFIEFDQKIIAGVLYFIFKDTIYPYFSGSNEKYNFTNSNNVMYYELMKFALRIGLRNFDFGRSRINTGAGKFKKNMGFEETPLYYYYYSLNQKEIPNLSPSNKRFDIFSKIWSKLPLSTIELLGPSIVKRIP